MRVWYVLFIVISSFSFIHCSDDRPIQISRDFNTNSNSTSGSSSNSETTYLNSKIVKVSFHKDDFYNNSYTNGYACAGDAKNYFDAFSDRQIPTKPSWLKNVSVDITNSNAYNGVGYASSCGLNGLGSPPPANCATFDDLQPLNGNPSRSILIGGYGCTIADNSCTTNNSTNDIWTLNTPSDSLSLAWTSQATGLPILSAGSYAGMSWAAGDYAELQDQFYLFGGVTPSAAATAQNGAFSFNSSLVKVTFNSDGSVNTTSSVSLSANNKTTYAGWQNSNIAGQHGGTAPSAPSAVTGATFTYGLRRNPTTKSFCIQGDNGVVDGGADSGDGTDDGDTNDYCAGSGTAAGDQKIYSTNEHQDYFLLLGGMKSGGSFSNTVYTYKTINKSNDLTSQSDPTGGQWNLMYSASNNYNTQMKVSDLTFSGNASAPVTVSSTSWVARAYHKTVYDPSMNRFYIFGGLAGADAAASNVTNELWIYDPPELGRKPTESCFSIETPDTGSTSLPVTTDIFGGLTNLDINLNYFSNRSVFPAGGCMQKITTSTTAPDARFEHSMAFDRDQKAVIVFGGCNQEPTAGATLYTSATNALGDPTLNCTASTSLFNDTWVYMTPTTTEVVSKDFISSLTNSPYNATETSRFPNIFGTDYWLFHKPLYTSNNSANSKILYAREDEVIGTWVKLTPTNKPTPRVSASLVYDNAHHKFYLYGGYGCKDTNCAQMGILNDVWEFIPPDFTNDCNRSSGTCSQQGTWTQIRTNNYADTTLPPPRKGGIMMYGNATNLKYGDNFYTIMDGACSGQGPYLTSDPETSKQYVGAIYIHLNREDFNSNENLLINVKYLPFDDTTRLPNFFTNSTPYTTTDDTDIASSADRAMFRVQLLRSNMSHEDQIQSTIQPRFHEFITGTTTIGNIFQYLTSGTGQLTERQLMIPLTFDSSINLVKIERVTGSAKFFEMTLSKY